MTPNKCEICKTNPAKPGETYCTDCWMRSIDKRYPDDGRVQILGVSGYTHATYDNGINLDAWDEPVVETMFGETHYYCPFCNSECVKDYCWVCKSELGTWRKDQDVEADDGEA